MRATGRRGRRGRHPRARERCPLHSLERLARIATRPSTRRLEVFFERAHAVLEDEEVGPVKIEHDDS